MKTCAHFLSYLAPLFVEGGTFQIKVVGKIKTHFMFHNFFFRMSCSVWSNVETYGRAEQATDDDMAQAHCMLDTKATNTHSEYVILITFPPQ